MSKEVTLSDVYQEEFAHIQHELGDPRYKLGIQTFQERIEEALNRYEGCGCNQCKQRFWAELCKAAEWGEAHGERACQGNIDALFDRVAPHLKHGEDA